MTISHRTSVAREFTRLRRSLKMLDRSVRNLVPMLVTMPENSEAKHSRRSRPHLTAKARASLVLQGRYMGYMRQLKPRQKAQVRKVKEAKGVRAAIGKARELAGR